MDCNVHFSELLTALSIFKSRLVKTLFLTLSTAAPTQVKFSIVSEILMAAHTYISTSGILMFMSIINFSKPCLIFAFIIFSEEIVQRPHIIVSSFLEFGSRLKCECVLRPTWDGSKSLKFT